MFFSEYTKAFQFDQLQKLMKDGKAFVGFQEGIINFPPTFKYDVARNPRLKHAPSKRGHSPHTPQAEILVNKSQEQLAHEDHDDDAVSLVSSVSQASSCGDERIELATRAVTQNDVSLDTKIKDKKTRKRWKSLITGFQSHRLQRHSVGKNAPRRSLEETQRKPKDSTPSPRHSLDDSQMFPPPTSMNNSIKTNLSSEDQLADKGVYDSSHKQRVPSW